eukprot:CAMPEP_0175828830 /NCGR_PEP_ID=MMETSP0107_2-20121207/13016_1 /TAXON_ID=195067 ORGANISM="Goniomonas pacifica, Strain CCMP1869" /NCGR_SAMPLE_ID=MMETSP0107_2 /ASSEMBLY_ACC=CAM_ASM_000203 /LENGTH=47 /DNA_ID= /DNA_START= /DNA_END= /DNA_ORIENTATION=
MTSTATIYPAGEDEPHSKPKGRIWGDDGPYKKAQRSYAQHMAAKYSR